MLIIIEGSEFKNSRRNIAMRGSQTVFAFCHVS